MVAHCAWWLHAHGWLPSTATAFLISHLSSFLGLLSLFSCRVRLALLWQSHLLYSPHEQFWCVHSSKWHQPSVEVSPGPMAPAPFMPQLLPAPSTSWVGSFGISWLGREPKCLQPSGWVWTTLQWLLYKWCFFPLLSEPVMIFWLLYLHKQCQFVYTGTKKS